MNFLERAAAGGGLFLSRLSISRKQLWPPVHDRLSRWGVPVLPSTGAGGGVGRVFSVDLPVRFGCPDNAEFVVGHTPEAGGAQSAQRRRATPNCSQLPGVHFERSSLTHEGIHERDFFPKIRPMLTDHRVEVGTLMLADVILVGLRHSRLL